MEILYLKSLQNYPIINGYKNEGVLLTEIEKVEHQLNIKFPKVYREFLFLAGKLNNGLFGNAIEDNLDWAVEDFQQDAAEELSEANVDLGKPFWVFTSMNGTEVFDFFYLNESENPAVYSWSRYDRKVLEQGLPIGTRKLHNSFSEYVDAAIEAHKKGIM